MSRPSVAHVLCAGLVALVLNSVYLAGRADPTIAYYVNVALHPLAGLALAALGGWRFRASWTATPLRAITSGTLAAAAALGIAVLIVGATRPYYAVVQAHVAMAVAGVALLSLELVRSTRARGPGVQPVLAGLHRGVLGRSGAIDAGGGSGASLPHSESRVRAGHHGSGRRWPGQPVLPFVCRNQWP